MKTRDRYDELVKQYLAEYKITSSLITDGLVKIGIIPKKQGWGECTFIFTGYHIVCFGDVETYSWNCTWDTAKNILNGSCHADNFSYLSSKLEHRHELMEFDFDDKTMDEIRKDIIEASGFNSYRRRKFNEKWKENLYLLESVEKNRLGGLDEFFYEMDVDDAYEYYHYFQDYQGHYYCAMAMLRCIEDYFVKEWAR